MARPALCMCSETDYDWLNNWVRVARQDTIIAVNGTFWRRRPEEGFGGGGEGGVGTLHISFGKARRLSTVLALALGWLLRRAVGCINDIFGFAFGAW